MADREDLWHFQLGITAALVGDVLRLHASTGPARFSLGAEQRDVPLGDIAAVTWKEPSLLTNGQLRVQSSVGLTGLIFTKKSSESARALYETLLARSGADGVTRATGAYANEAREDRYTKRQAAIEAWHQMKQEKYEAERAEWRRKNVERLGELEASAAGARVSAHPELGAVIALLNSVESDAVQADDEGTSQTLDPDDDGAEIDLAAVAPGGAPAPTVAEQVVKLLTMAEEFAAVGDARSEELRIAQALVYAKKMGKRADLREAEVAVSSRSREGALRIGAVFIGEVRAESGLAQYSRKKAFSKVVSGSRRIVVWSDRILVGGSVQLIDEHTSAQVYLDGQELITQRPTLTRMLLLSPLPGSALIPGLAFQKKTTHDLRQAEFQVRSIGWSFRAPIAPNDLSEPRQIAERLNAAAEAIRRKVAPVAEAPGASTVLGSEALLAQLERLAFLVDRGTISAEEASQVRASILG